MALGAESRARESEKTLTERLEASVAERDAAVERVRSVCEAHNTSMRRRLELDWDNERDVMAQRAEEKLEQLRWVTPDCGTSGVRSFLYFCNVAQTTR